MQAIRYCQVLDDSLFNEVDWEISFSTYPTDVKESIVVTAIPFDFNVIHHCYHISSGETSNLIKAE